MESYFGYRWSQMKLISEVPVLSLTVINEQSLVNEPERVQFLDIYTLIILIGFVTSIFSTFIFGPTFEKLSGPDYFYYLRTNCVV